MTLVSTNGAKVWISSFQKKKENLKPTHHFQDTGMDTITYLKDPGDPTKMGNLLMDHTQFTQAYVKSAVEEQHKLYDSYDHLNNHSACYTLLDSLDISFKKHIKDHLPDNFCFPLVWMQVIKALQSSSLKCFKTMKCKLESIKLQQYQGQNITDMLLDVTYHCQGLTTAGIWDHQLCSSILSAFLLANGDEMYHHSLITMKSTLEDKLKKVRFMIILLEPPTFTAKDLPMPTFVTLLKLSTK